MGGRGIFAVLTFLIDDIPDIIKTKFNPPKELLPKKVHIPSGSVSTINEIMKGVKENENSGITPNFDTKP